MELAESLVVGLSAVANESQLPDAAFAELIKLVAKDALTDERPGNGDAADLAQAKALGSVNPAVLKEAHAALLSVVWEAARADLDGDALRSVLEDTKLSPARAGAVAAAYADLRTDVRARLARTAPTFPHITDVKWRLDYYVKNNNVDKVNKPIYLVSLQTTQPAGAAAGADQVQFTCTVEQLQDLVDRLKDAAKAVQTIGQ